MPIRKRYQYEGHGLLVEGAKVGRLNMGINTNFIIYRIGSRLIDTGPANQWKFAKQFITEKPVSELWITHHHEDHSGNAQRISELFDIVPFAPIQAADKLKNGYKTPFFQSLIWGKPQKLKRMQPLPEQLELEDGSPVIPVHTPGHAKDLTCFYLPKQKWFFSGDLYLAKTLKLMRSDENLELLMQSIKKALQYDFEVLFCPHKGIEEDGYNCLSEKLSNLVKICQDAQAHQQQGKSLEDITLEMLGPKEPVDKLSGGNISKENLIREALKVDLSQFT